MTTVLLHVLRYVQPDKLMHEVREYTQVKSMLIAVEKNDESNAPYGLKRIRVADLPKVGGLLGTAAVARTEREARALIIKVLERRLVAAERDVMCWKKGLVRLRLSAEES